MRLHRIRLRNYRGVADREVTFADAGITIVEGPNEAGKTSLAEALALLFDEPDSSSKSLVRAAKPVHKDEGPEVEVDLTTGPYELRYAKRWQKRPMTTLEIKAPRREQLTGRVAHDRARAILNETLDWGLWKALRVQQNALLTQATLAANPSLVAALDAVSGGGLSGDAESLFTRVESECRRYFTATGRPTGDYKASVDDAVRAQTAADNARAAIAAVEADADEHAAVSAEIPALKGEEQANAAEMEQLDGQWKDVKEQQRQLAELAGLCNVEQERLDAARRDLEARRQLVLDQESRLNDVDARGTEGERLAPAVVAAQERADAAASKYETARQAGQATADLARIASEDVAYQRDLIDRQLLAERQERALAARQQIEAAERTLAVCLVDDAKLKKLEDAYLNVVKAGAALSAESAQMSLEALAAADVLIDGEARAMAPGPPAEIPVTRPVELIVPGTLRIRVTPGMGEQGRTQALRRAETEFRALCDKSRVADIGEARDRHAQRRDAAQAQKVARKTLEESLRDLTLEDLGQKIAALAARSADYRQRRPAEPPAPADLPAAEAAAEEARKAGADAAAAAKRAEAERDRLAEAAAAARAEAAERNVRFEDAQTELARTEARLAAARAKASDESLEGKHQAARDAWAAALAKKAEQEKVVGGLDPEGVQLRLENARQLADRLAKDLRAREDRVLRLGERIAVAGGQGLQDVLDSAETALIAGRRRSEGSTRRAEAARLLYETMREHRDAAKRTYVAPFREQIERLGRILHGATFSVELDDELQIKCRTLDGITVEFDSLSAGAKEQLCIVARLACAALVSPDEGVPMIVDDALGHSDPQRLQRIGAVFNAAGQRTQVIILTCVPDRYRGIGSAKVVSLSDGRSER